MKSHNRVQATEELIAAAESQLGIRLPEELKQAWLLYNCNELRGGWRVFPVFDPGNPRKTCNNIVYENLKGPWGQRVMEMGFVSIADNGTGNQLVLKVDNCSAIAPVLLWQHETEKVKLWAPGITSIVESARRSAASVERLQQRFARPG